MKRSHIYYFDYIKIMAMIFVIFMHTAAGLLNVGSGFSWNLLNISISVSYTAVPLFLMMSGYLVLSEEMESDSYLSKLFRRRIPRLLLPLAAWTSAAILWQMFLEQTWTAGAVIDKIIYSLKEPVMVHFWYMYTLIAIYIISPLFCGIRLLGQKCRRYIFGVIMLCTFYTAVNAVLTLSVKGNVTVDLPARLLAWSAGGHLLSFVLGYFLETTKIRIPNTVLIISVIGTWGFISLATYMLTTRSGEYNQTFQVQSSGFEVILAMLIFLLFKQNFNKESRFHGFVRELSTMSLPIYLMHNILLGMLYYMGIRPSGFASVCMITVLNLAICYLVVKTAATIKPLCYLATGITFSEACHSCNWIYSFHRIKCIYGHRRHTHGK